MVIPGSCPLCSFDISQRFFSALYPSCTDTTTSSSLNNWERFLGLKTLDIHNDQFSVSFFLERRGSFYISDFCSGLAARMAMPLITCKMDSCDGLLQQQSPCRENTNKLHRERKQSRNQWAAGMHICNKPLSSTKQKLTRVILYTHFVCCLVLV